MIRNVENPSALTVTVLDKTELISLLEIQEWGFMGFIGVDSHGCPYYICNDGKGWSAAICGGLIGFEQLDDEDCSIEYPVTLIWQENLNDRIGWNE